MPKPLLSNDHHACLDKVSRFDWLKIGNELTQSGFALTPPIFDRKHCEQFASFYEQKNIFRKKIDMQQYQFGSGEYQYFNYPLPPVVEEFRQSFYTHLAPIANQWSERLKLKQHWPKTLEEYLTKNRSLGQSKATPLMLRYTSNDYNCLHQDRYGELFFPFQAVLLLSKPKTDFIGGEFVLVENRPRMQSRVQVVTIEQGQTLIFPGQFGIRKTIRGYSKTSYRHGVSKINSGTRSSLGIIFHDAK